MEGQDLVATFPDPLPVNFGVHTLNYTSTGLGITARLTSFLPPFCWQVIGSFIKAAEGQDQPAFVGADTDDIMHRMLELHRGHGFNLESAQDELEVASASGGPLLFPALDSSCPPSTVSRLLMSAVRHADFSSNHFSLVVRFWLFVGPQMHSATSCRNPRALPCNSQPKASICKDHNRFPSCLALPWPYLPAVFCASYCTVFALPSQAFPGTVNWICYAWTKQQCLMLLIVALC